MRLIAQAVVLVLGVAWLTASPSARQAAPQTRPPGYPGAEGVAPRPPEADVPPVYAKPAIDTLATVKRRGRLRVGVASAPPWVVRDQDGELMGFSVDLARKLADDIGVSLELVPTSWPHIIDDLLDNHFDVIASGLWITPARALLVNYTQATSMAAVSLIGGRPLAGALTGANDFDKAGVTIVVNRGTEMEDVAAVRFPRATLLKVGLDDDPLAPVLDGRAHGALVMSPAARATVGASGDKLFLPSGADVTTASAALAIRKGDLDFLNFLDAWLTFHRESKWTADRLDYWFTSVEWMKRL